jgi:hypothetical protein
MSDQQWEQKYTELGIFIKLHDRLPKSYEEPIHWVNMQRHLYNNDKLSTDQIEKLESLHHWLWEPNSAKWEKRYFDFIELIKNKDIEHFSKDRKYGLTCWINRQEARKNKGNLKKWQLEMLDRINFWVIKDSYVISCDDWEKQYTEFKDQATASLGFSSRSSNWAHTQKTLYREGKLSEKKIELLEGIPGWIWENTEDSNWEVKFLRLEEFVENNDGSMDGLYARGSSDLYNWVRMQIYNYRNGKLDRAKAEKLESIPGWKWGSKKRKSTTENISASKKTKLEQL